MDKEDVVYIYNGILPSHKKDKMLPFATTQMDLEGMMLNKIRQTEKDKHCMISLMWKRNKYMDKEIRLVVTRGEGVGSG